MSKELAFVLINPYTIAKSRTGGVIARYTSRTSLKFVGARMFGPSAELVEEYADLVRHGDPSSPQTCAALADYIQVHYAPDAETGRRRRVMMLLFEGEDAVQTIWDVTGNSNSRSGFGETVRETFGDFITDADGKLIHFEPAVLVAPTHDRAAASLRLWASYAGDDGGIIASGDVSGGEGIERTLVMLKPDNFRYPSLRAGSIIDVLSSSGLRIVAVNKFHMFMAQAEQFYGPVRDVLARKFSDIGGKRLAQCITDEFQFEVPVDVARGFCDQLGCLFATSQFERIVEFMTGRRPSDGVEAEDGEAPEECLALVYEGVGAVEKIRKILGATDPSKAEPGSVRREFGSNIMVNAAHASDSVENAAREMSIVKVDEDRITPRVAKYYGA